jgi:uncharacterized protein involved in exopolysaccharide biosynthesis
MSAAPTSSRLLDRLWAHKWLLVACVLASVVATNIALRFYPPTYRSDTTILVVPQRVPEAYVRSTTTTKIEDRLNTITQQILSRTRLERIINEYNLYADRRRSGIMEDVVQGMRDDIHPEVLRHDAFRISYKGSNPRTVQKVTERLASLFIEENLNDRATLADSTNQFLQAQAEDTRRGLEEVETTIASTKRAGQPLSTAESIEYNVLQQQYKDLLNKIQESRMAANLERRQIGEQFKLLDAARIPEEPITPNRKAANAIGAAVGLGLGVILSGVISRRRRPIDDDDDDAEDNYDDEDDDGADDEDAADR